MKKIKFIYHTEKYLNAAILKESTQQGRNIIYMMCTVILQKSLCL